jgi:Rod binding domain-containing protein
MVDGIGQQATALGSPLLDTPAVNPGRSGSNVHQAAQQFEALLIGQLLKSAREAGGSGWLGAGDDDQAGEIGMEVAEQQFASMLAASGGIGLAKLVESGLNRDSARHTEPPEGSGGN